MENLLILISMKEKVQQKKKTIFNTELEFQAVIYIFFFHIHNIFDCKGLHITEKKKIIIILRLP